MHLSCLPAALGRGGRAFVDWLAQAGFTIWQILPVGPTGSDGSPYWGRSDAAGNAALIDAEEMPARACDEFHAFVAASGDWLDDYARFEVLSALHGGAPWWQWPAAHRDRDIGALERL